MKEQNISKKLDGAYKAGRLAKLKEAFDKASTKEDFEKIIEEANYQFNRCYRQYDWSGRSEFLYIHTISLNAYKKIK